jgi:HPt (histidine-containing phosphotransfer) domain-containing protein
MSADPGVMSLDTAVMDQLAEDLGLDLLPRLFSTFVVEIESRMTALQDAIEAGDAAAAGEEGHAIKGSAATFGMADLRDKAFELELAGRDGDLGRVRRLVPECLVLCNAACDLMRAGPPARWRN